MLRKLLASVIAATLALAPYSGLRDAEAFTSAQKSVHLVKPRNNPLFGINMSGAERFTVSWPTAADWAYVASKGVTFVRLPVAWENLLTTVGGSTLQATYLANLKTAISQAHAVGIGVIVDLHNFGAYAAAAQWGSTVTYAGNDGVAATGVSFLGNGITSANLANIWTLLSTAIKGSPGLIGYDLMNEPVQSVGPNLLTSPNNFLDSSVWATSAVVLTQTGTVGPTGLANAWTMASSGFGWVSQNPTLLAVPYIYSVYALAPTGSPSLSIGLDFNGPDQVLTASWARYSNIFLPSAGTHNVDIQVDTSGAHTINLYGAQLELAPVTASLTASTIAGTTLTTTVSSGAINIGDMLVGASVTNGTTILSQLTGTTGQSGTYQLSASSTVAAGEVMTTYSTVPSAYQGNPYTAFAQVAVNAIRAVDASLPIYICGGVDFASAATWQTYNYEMALMTGGNLIFEAHNYFDAVPPGSGSSTYSGTYTSYGVVSTSGITDIAPWLAWLQATGVKGFLGELGVPNRATDNDSAWLALQKNVFEILRTNNIPAALWYYGSNGNNAGDLLNIAPQSGVNDPRLLQMLAIH